MEMNILEFWELTPYEFSVRADRYYQKIKNKQEEEITLAYMTAYWTAQWFSKKKPESLEKILGTKKVSKEMSDDEMLSQVKNLNKILGGEVI